MARCSSRFGQVVWHLMVPLIALWPVICCCWSEWVGGSADEATAVAPADEHSGGGCHESGEGGSPSTESGACHGEAGGPCHEDGSGSCACSKSKTALASASGPVEYVVPALAWSPAALVLVIPPSTPARWFLKVERLPPTSLSRLRVLRI